MVSYKIIAKKKKTVTSMIIYNSWFHGGIFLPLKNFRRFYGHFHCDTDKSDMSIIVDITSFLLDTNMKLTHLD